MKRLHCVSWRPVGTRGRAAAPTRAPAAPRGPSLTDGVPELAALADGGQLQQLPPVFAAPTLFVQSS